ncbi:MAG: SAF domain-containing protein [Actinomycetota bacterium]
MSSSSPRRAELRSPFRSIPVAVGAVRSRLRRHRAGRRALFIVALGLAASHLNGAISDAVTARDHWSPGPSIWATTTDISSGDIIQPDMVQRIELPAGVVPEGALVNDPSGSRSRVDLVVGEIVIADRVSEAGSAFAARTPPGTATIALSRTSELFAIGDRVDLHDLSDGRRLTADGVVVATTDRDLAVAVAIADIASVVRASGAAGVVAVLRTD